MNTMVIIFLCLILACPICALAFNWALGSRPVIAARLAGYCMGVGLLMGMGLIYCLSLSDTSVSYLLISCNTMTMLLCDLVLLVSFIVHRFSSRYMDGDRLYGRFFLILSGITLAVMLMVLADNLFLFWGAWSFSNLFLVLLMVHKKEWVAARNAGLLALFALSIGSLSLLIAVIILSFTYSTGSISVLTQLTNPNHLSLLCLSMGFILISGMVQSGLFPFHRWLISSLNSPTPVSALMHAGLINGGGILIVKFAPLMVLHPNLLTVLFIIGSMSALLGTIWKLMQHDVKKMLACSTMAQMGFMMMQCGVGLFSAAIAHLCWHGLFKAYLFLSSGSAIKQKKPESYPSNVSPIVVLASLVGGAVTMVSFAFITQKPLSLYQASGFVLFFAFIAGAQLTFTWIRSHQTLFSLSSSLVLAAFFGVMYGASIQLIQWLIPSISIIKTLHLSIIHWVIMGMFGTLWAVFNFKPYKTIARTKLGCWLYMTLFNSSQPARKTITVLRNEYNY